MSNPFDLLPCDVWAIVARHIVASYECTCDDPEAETRIAAISMFANTCTQFRALVREQVWLPDLKVYYDDDPFVVDRGHAVCESADSDSFSWFVRAKLTMAVTHLRGARVLKVACCGSSPRLVIEWLREFRSRFRFRELELDFSGNDTCDISEYSECVSFASCLTRLDISETDITSDRLAKLLDNTSLRSLAVSGCHYLNKDALSIVSRHAGPQLTRLVATQGEYMTAFKDLQPANLPALTAVHMARQACHGERVHATDIVLHLSSFRALRRLHVQPTQHESNSTLLQLIARCCPLLEMLFVDSNWVRNDINTVSPLAALKHLRDLKLCRPDALSLRDVADSLCGLEDLRVIHMLDCRNDCVEEEGMLPSGFLADYDSPVSYLLRKLPRLDFDRCSLTEYDRKHVPGPQSMNALAEHHVASTTRVSTQWPACLRAQPMPTTAVLFESAARTMALDLGRLVNVTDLSLFSRRDARISARPEGATRQSYAVAVAGIVRQASRLPKLRRLIVCAESFLAATPGPTCPFPALRTIHLDQAPMEFAPPDQAALLFDSAAFPCLKEYRVDHCYKRTREWLFDISNGFAWTIADNAQRTCKINIDGMRCSPIVRGVIRSA